MSTPHTCGISIQLRISTQSCKQGPDYHYIQSMYNEYKLSSSSQILPSLTLCKQLYITRLNMIRHFCRRLMLLNGRQFPQKLQGPEISPAKIYVKLWTSLRHNKLHIYKYLWAASEHLIGELDILVGSRLWWPDHAEVTVAVTRHDSVDPQSQPCPPVLCVSEINKWLRVRWEK